MRPTGLLLLAASTILGHAVAEAFFLRSLDSVLGGPAPRRALHRLPPRPHRQPRRQAAHRPYSTRTHHFAKPVARPTRHYPPALARPVRQPADPGANVKLDYGGWTAIGFDDSLPGQYDQPGAAPAPAPAPRIVTLEAAIASAPVAQSDDLTYTPEAPRLPRAEAPAPAPAYQPAAPAYQPPTKKYQATSTYGVPVPAVPYIPSTASHPAFDYNNPAVAPAYEAPVPQLKPSSVPQTSKPLKKAQKKPVAKYQKPKPSTKHQKAYEPAVTSRPDVVVLPAFTPAPPAYSPPAAYRDAEPAFGGEQFPIVALITADSPVPEDQKYVSFSIGGAKNGGSPDSLPDPGEYQATGDTTRLAKDVNGVYVQPATAGQDELYYIYYQDPELDPSYGVKIPAARSPRLAAVPAAPLADFPVYDYDEARDADTARIERNAEPRRPRLEPTFRSISRYGTDFRASSPPSRGSVSFTTSVGGKSSGFSYRL